MTLYQITEYNETVFPKGEITYGVRHDKLRRWVRWATDDGSTVTIERLPEGEPRHRKPILFGPSQVNGELAVEEAVSRGVVVRDLMGKHR